MKNKFEKNEIEAAKRVKAKMLSGEMPMEMISAYMAGEICMWDELQNEEQPAQSEAKPQCTCKTRQEARSCGSACKFS